MRSIQCFTDNVKKRSKCQAPKIAFKHIRKSKRQNFKAVFNVYTLETFRSDCLKNRSQSLSCDCLWIRKIPGASRAPIPRSKNPANAESLLCALSVHEVQASGSCVDTGSILVSYKFHQFTYYVLHSNCINALYLYSIYK